MKYSIGLLVLLLPAAGFGASVTLQNDGFVSGNQAGFQGGFVANECWASVFVPDADAYPITVKAVQMLVGGDYGIGGQTIFEVSLYDVDASNKPRDKRGGEAVLMTGSESALQLVDIQDLGISTQPATFDAGNFAVSVCLYEHSGFPAIARDDDGQNTYPDRNWIYEQTMGWVKSKSFFVNGDWVMRAVVETASGETTPVEPGDTTPIDEPGDDIGEETPTPEPESSEPTVDSKELVLTKVTPSSTDEGTSVDIVILGEGFTDAMTATIGGLSITGLEFVSDTTLSGRTPTALPTGLHTIEVIALDGARASVNEAFTVHAVDSGCQAVRLEFMWVLCATLLAGLLYRRRFG